MRIIEIAPLSNGAHRNQNGGVSVVPEGWAVLPEDMACENFPFGVVEATEIDGGMTVIKWTPLPMPNPVPSEEVPSQLDIIEAQVTYTAMMTDSLLEV